MFKSEPARIFAISILLVLGLFAVSFFLFASGASPVSIHEGKLAKNAQFSMRPGDHLSYEIISGNESEIITFLFGREPFRNATIADLEYADCTKVVIKGTNVSTCISPDGTDIGGNVSLASQAFFFFSPWMLALSPGFSWDVVIENSLTGAPIESVGVRVLGEEEIFGRSAYLAELRDDGIMGNYTKRMWIDKESRVLLKEEGKDYSIIIAQARFPLQR